MTTIAKPCLTVHQPIGEFTLTVLPADELVKRALIAPRRTSDVANENVQRELSGRRVKEIAQYVEDPDATFPTPIILSVSSDAADITDGVINFHLDDQERVASIGEVLDGQHRIRGLAQAQRNGTPIEAFELPVVVMFDLTPSEKAYVFSIINSKQTPVGKSLIYDLFGLSDSRSPQRTCHEIARAMNQDKDGPFFHGLKMLGRRTAPSELLTQGSFVKYLLQLISRDPDNLRIASRKGNDITSEEALPFNKFWREGKDELILTVMTNYFSAIQRVFPEDWDISAYGPKPANLASSPVLRRTVGYEALMKVLRELWAEASAQRDISTRYFEERATECKRRARGTPLTAENFGSSSADASKLAKLLLTGSTDEAG